jgi:hypothetical protein
MRVAFAAFGLLLLASLPAVAQQLEPRAYSPAPVGLNILVVPFVHSTGSVVTDPSLPVANVDAKINFLVPLYVRSFSLFGRAASAALTLPYVWGSVSGDVMEQRQEVSRSGQGDMALRLVTNLIGNRAMTPREFARAEPRTILGASLVVSMPTGQYDGSKLINIGTNRWAFKPEVGLSQPVGKWDFDFYAGAWFFTTNDNFFGGVTRSQKPIVALQGHVSYSFKPGLWLAVDGTWYSGGQTTVGGVLKADRQDNARIGLTLAVPLSRAQSLKAVWTRGATTRVGQNFTTYSLAYQFRWF